MKKHAPYTPHRLHVIPHGSKDRGLGGGHCCRLPELRAIVQMLDTPEGCSWAGLGGGGGRPLGGDYYVPSSSLQPASWPSQGAQMWSARVSRSEVGKKS